VDAWMQDFPAFYALTDPETKFDTRHQYIVLQRRNLHAIGYAAMLTPLKAFLTSSTPPQTGLERSLRDLAIDTALRLLDAGRAMFDFVFPIRAKYHFVVFCIFDTTAVLCAAILHDSSHTLPRRGEIVAAIAGALALMEQLSRITKTGAMSFSIARKLIAHLPMTPQERVALTGTASGVQKRARMEVKLDGTREVASTGSNKHATAIATAVEPWRNNSSLTPEQPSTYSTSSLTDTPPTDAFNNAPSVPPSDEGYQTVTTDFDGLPPMTFDMEQHIPGMTTVAQGVSEWNFPDVHFTQTGDMGVGLGCPGANQFEDLQFDPNLDWETLNLGMA
jgi:hypothetical protein